MNVITGLQAPDSGSVRLGDAEITGWSAPRRARAGLGRTFQGARLFDRLSVRENVEVVALSGGLRRRAAAAKARELLDLFALGEVAEREARSLPHGTARRLGVARALALEPSFLLLDEPAAGLDEAEGDALLGVLAGIPASRGCGVLVIDHDMRLIMRLCQRLHVLAYGRTIAEGTAEEIRRSPAVIGAYLGSSETEA